MPIKLRKTVQRSIVKITPSLASGKLYANPKKITIVTANMCKVIPSTKHCLLSCNNPLLTQVLLSPSCRCTEKLNNLSEVTTACICGLKSNHLNPDSVLESKIHCLPFYGKIPMPLNGKANVPLMKNKNGAQRFHKDFILLNQTELQTKSNHKTCLLLFSPFSLSHSPYQHIVLQNSTLMPGFQDLPFHGSSCAIL